MSRAGFLHHAACCAAAFWAVLFPSAAWGLNPSLDVTQYGHRAWRSFDGFGFGTISAIAQTTDGYIWLGTPTGLLRFDGVRSTPIAPVPGNAFDDGVRALLGARDGTLWIATRRGLFALRSGVIQAESSMSGMLVNAIDEDPDGNVWAAGAANGKGVLCTIGGRLSECNDEGGRYGPEILALHRDSGHSLWIVGVDRAWKMGEGSIVSFALPGSADALRSVTDTTDGALLIGLRGKVVRIAGGRVEAFRLPSWTSSVAFDKALRTRDGSLWLGTSDSGLIHLHEGRLDTFTTSDGLSGNKILDLFEDREGNVWVSTLRGLDQFRSTTAVTQTDLNGLKGRCRAVLSARDGTLWASMTTGIYQRDASGLWQLRRSWLAGVYSLYEDQRGRIWAQSRQRLQYFDGQAFVDATGIPAGHIDAMTDGAHGDLWIAHGELGLLRVQARDKANFSTQFVSKPLTRVSALATDPVDQSLWVGQWSGTLEKVRDGHVIASFALLDGSTAQPGIKHIRAEPDGALWVSTSNGLMRLAHGHVAKLSVDAGPQCDRILWSLADGKSLWMSASCGLLRVARTDVDDWVNATDNGRPLQVAAHLLDNWDGVTPSDRGIGYASDVVDVSDSPKMTLSKAGSLWVVAGPSLVTVDTDWAPVAAPPPPVYVEKLISEGMNYPLQPSILLPPLQHNLEIDYTALRFASPQRLLFRYKLEGYEADWQEVGNRRQAFYTDLPPGRYRFLVSAASTGHNWSAPAAQEFEIAPAFVQTRTFRGLCAVSFVVLLACLMRWRARHLTKLERTRLEGKMRERERIARDLHDTLLQSTEGLILHFHSTASALPSDDPMRVAIEKALDQANQVMAEGRDRVLDLRLAADTLQELPEAFAALGRGLGERYGVDFRTVVQGTPQPLQHDIQDEAYQVGREALFNAFRHAKAGSIELEIIYSTQDFRIRVRDDGQGIESAMLPAGARPGHWGLPGMRERAHEFGATLEIWSRRGAGTEVELVVPTARAYLASAVARPGWRPRWRTARAVR